jgi:uncharacterized membrane protein
MMDKILAQYIDERTKASYARQRFHEYVQDSLLFFPFVFMLLATLLVFITRRVDKFLLSLSEIPGWELIDASMAVTVSSLVSSSVLALLAIVFSISLVALQLANQQYSPRVIRSFERSNVTKVALSLFIATFAYSFILLIEVLRSHFEQITIVSLTTDILLVLASLIVFIVFMKSILMMMRVSYIITIIAEETSRSIAENLPLKEAYVMCESVPLEKPSQIICYSRPPKSLFSRRYDHGVFRALERSTLLQIGSEYECVLRVLPRYGDYINQGDPLVEVYGETTVPLEQVLKAIYVGHERSVYQDPSYGIRVLVDIALQALSPAVNAPTTAHQVILRLTNLLAMISERPDPTGVYTEDNRRFRLLQPVFTWDDYVELAFSEIIHYGMDDPQTRRSLKTAFDYLLKKVPEVYRSPLEQQKKLLTRTVDNG